jgi:hypothetical protein
LGLEIIVQHLLQKNTLKKECDENNIRNGLLAVSIQVRRRKKKEESVDL